MALARLPVMPLRMKMMEMRCQPASFSKSRSTVIWNVTDTRQWMMLGERPCVRDPCPALPPSALGHETAHRTPPLRAPVTVAWECLSFFSPTPS